MSDAQPTHLSSATVRTTHTTTEKPTQTRRSPDDAPAFLQDERRVESVSNGSACALRGGEIHSRRMHDVHPCACLCARRALTGPVQTSFRRVDQLVWVGVIAGKQAVFDLRERPHIAINEHPCPLSRRQYNENPDHATAFRLKLHSFHDAVQRHRDFPIGRLAMPLIRHHLRAHRLR